MLINSKYLILEADVYSVLQAKYFHSQLIKNSLYASKKGYEC